MDCTYLDTHCRLFPLFRVLENVAAVITLSERRASAIRFSYPGLLVKTLDACYCHKEQSEIPAREDERRIVVVESLTLTILDALNIVETRNPGAFRDDRLRWLALESAEGYDLHEVLDQCVTLIGSGSELGSLLALEALRHGCRVTLSAAGDTLPPARGLHIVGFDSVHLAKWIEAASGLSTGAGDYEVADDCSRTEFVRANTKTGRSDGALEFWKRLIDEILR